jgi:membrane protease YdiL (CAAX protease family)
VPAPATRWIERHDLASYFVLAFTLSWLVEVPLALRGLGLVRLPIPFAAHYLAGYGPLLAALAVTWASAGRAGVRDLAARLVRWRVAPAWWLVAVAPLVAYGLLALLLRTFGADRLGLGALGRVDFLPDLGSAAVPFWILTFGLGEEAGWRGFALPRLQRSRNALSATVLLWLFWALWHLPAFFFLYPPATAPGVLVGLLAGAITFTWLYNSTRGSVLIVAVFHGLFDLTTACTDCKTGVVAAVLSTLVMVWAVLVVVLFKPANLSRAPKQILHDLGIPDTEIPSVRLTS